MFCWQIYISDMFASSESITAYQDRYPILAVERLIWLLDRVLALAMLAVVPIDRVLVLAVFDRDRFAFELV